MDTRNTGGTMHSEHSEFSINPIRHWSIENIVLRLTKTIPETSEPDTVQKVWDFIQDFTGESILGARGYSQELRSLGIRSRLNEEELALELGRSVCIPVYTRDGYFEMCEAKGHSVPLLAPTDELLTDENQLGFALYEYCFGMPLDNPHDPRLVRTARSGKYGHIFPEILATFCEGPVGCLFRPSGGSF
jgi:hypothetical protein